MNIPVNSLQRNDPQTDHMKSNIVYSLFIISKEYFSTVFTISLKGGCPLH